MYLARRVIHIRTRFTHTLHSHTVHADEHGQQLHIPADKTDSRGSLSSARGSTLDLPGLLPLLRTEHVSRAHMLAHEHSRPVAHHPRDALLAYNKS